jgi:hypothetical protein
MKPISCSIGERKSNSVKSEEAVRTIFNMWQYVALQTKIIFTQSGRNSMGQDTSFSWTEIVEWGGKTAKQ